MEVQKLFWNRSTTACNFLSISLQPFDRGKKKRKLVAEVDRILEIACIINDGKLTKTLEDPDLVIHQSKETMQELHMAINLGDCAAFLSNYNLKSITRVTFNNTRYNLSPWSMSIFPDCENVIFPTTTFGVRLSQVKMLPTYVEFCPRDTFNEDISLASDDSTFNVIGLLEQLNVTRVANDYLWQTTNVDISSS